MADNYYSFRNLKFLTHELFKLSELNRFERYKEYDDEAILMALDAARQIGDRLLFPIYEEMDRKKAYYDKGTVFVHPQIKTIMRSLSAGGWIAAADDYEYEGQQMPLSLLNAGLYTFYAANANAAPYAFLTQGAANLIRTFGSEELQKTFVPKMYAGEWQGTMAMTEPQAGSSLSDLTTSATPTAEGHYKIKGQKIYISGGDHNAVDNVVHLLLARIEGEALGTRTISLFVVPKKRIENGELVSNDVNTAGIFGKMGQKGYVAATLMYGEQDDCHGYLVGEPNRGLPYMFQMMNEARIGTGLMATGTATAAYYAALQYANERSQGRPPSNKDVNLAQIPIIEHADVKRMLLFQKSVTEGSLSLLMQLSLWADIEREATGDEKEKAGQLLELLTPIAKTFPSEYGTQAVSASMQTMGGAGYCDDFPVEQYYRDIRVNAIYEGTTGIQGMDLLGRKVTAHNGKSMRLLMEEIHSTIDAAQQVEGLQAYANKMIEGVKSLHQCTMHQMQNAMNEKAEVFLSDATLYLEYFSLVTISWQLLKQAVVAQKVVNQEDKHHDFEFYKGKVYAMQYFLNYELPKTRGLHDRLMSKDTMTVDMEAAFIN